MADAYRGLTIEFSGDTTKLSKALTQVNRDIRTTGTALTQVERGLKFNPGNTTLVAQQQTLLQREITSTKTKLEMLKKTNESYANAVGPLSEDERLGWEKVQREIVTTSSTLTHYKQLLAESIIQQEAHSSVLGQAATQVTNFNKRWAETGTLLTSVGGTLTRTVTVGMGVAAVASIAAATSIDTALTGVRKTVNGTDEQYQQLKESAIEFSKTNAVSASQILDIQALGAQLGFSIDELDEFSRVVSGLDIATNMDAETAATQMAQFANITKMSHDEISNYGASIVELGNHFSTTEADINDMAMRVAAAGTQVGMSQADILGFSTALASMGVEAEAGGTAISTIMSQIDKDIALNKDSVQTWASAAQMSAEDFSNAWKSDPTSALAAVLTGMDAATQSGGNLSVMLEELGIDSIRQTDVMKRLAGNSSLVSSAVADANKGWSENTALTNEVANRNESIAAKFEMVANKAIAVGDAVGGPLADAALDAMDAAEPLFTTISDGAQAFADMGENGQRTVLMLAGAAAAAGPVASATGKIITATKGVGEWLDKASISWAKNKTASVEANAATATSSATATTAVEAQTKATKTMSAVTGVAKLAVAGLALAGIAVLVNEAMNAKKRQDNLTKSTEGLERAARNAGSATAFQEGKMSLLGTATQQTMLDYDAFLEKQAQYADTINENNSAAQSNITMLMSAKDAIDEYAGKTNLSTEAQSRLKAAIEIVNEQCGTQYEVTDAANGIIYDHATATDVASEAIDNYIVKKMEQIRVDALTQNLETLYQAQAAAVDAYTQAQKDYNAAVDEKNRVESESTEGMTRGSSEWADHTKRVNEAEIAYSNAEEKLAGTKDGLDSANASLSATESQLGLASSAAQGATNSYQDFINHNYILQSAISTAGQSLDQFQGDLASTGASTELLNSLSQDQLTQLGLAYDGTVGSIQSKLWEFAAATEGPGVDAANNWRNGFSENTQGMIDAALSASGLTLAQFQLLASEAGISGEDAISSLSQSLSDPNGNATEATQKLMDAVALKMTGGDVEAASKIVGHDLGSGLAQGIDQNSDDAKQKALDMANGVIEQTKTAFDTHSPSVVFHDIGLNLGQGLADGINEGADLASAAADGLSKLASDHMSSASVDAWFAGSSLVNDGFAAGISGGQSGAASAADALSKLAADHLSSAGSDAWWAGNNMAADSFASGMSNGGGGAAGAADYVSKLAADHMSSANVDAWWAGRNLAAGMAQGIRDGSYEVTSASQVMASEAVQAAKRELDEHSPSRVTKQIGGYFSQGLALGIEEKGSLAVSAARKVALASASAAVMPTVRAAGSSTVKVGNSTLSVSNATDGAMVAQLATLNARLSNIENGVNALPRTISENAPVLVQTPRQAKIAAREANRG